MVKSWDSADHGRLLFIYLYGGCMRTAFFSSAVPFALVIMLLSPITTAQAQIPNAGFESWSGGEPVDWSTNNSPDLVLVTQTNVAHSGASAAQGTALSVATFGVGPALTTGAEGGGFPINFRPAALHGFYTFTSVSGDYFTGTVALSKGGAGVGGGTALVLGEAGSYTEFVVNIIYASEDVPDTAYIVFTIGNPSVFVHAGSTFRVDDLSWGASSGVKEIAGNQPTRFDLDQNYPNPFNPSTTISFSVPDNGFVTLKVYDLMGQEVSTLVEKQLTPGRYETTFSAGSLASGLYMYQLTAGGKVETRRMLLLK
jgi:hypothetical protein